MSWLSWFSDLAAVDFTQPLTAYLKDSDFLAYAILGATTLPPLVPNSAILVTGGVLAARGDLNIIAVFAVVALSALLGDMVFHRGGRAMSGRVRSRLYRRPKRRALLDWTSRQVQHHGVPFVIACRFLPSGRLFGGLAAGIVRFPASRYLVGALIAETVWASYSVGVGFFSGQATSNSLYAVGIGLGVSATVASIGGIVQWFARRRERSRPRLVTDHHIPEPRHAGSSGAVVPSAESLDSDSSVLISADPDHLVDPGPTPASGHDGFAAKPHDRGAQQFKGISPWAVLRPLPAPPPAAGHRPWCPTTGEPTIIRPTAARPATRHPRCP